MCIETLYHIVSMTGVCIRNAHKGKTVTTKALMETSKAYMEPKGKISAQHKSLVGDSKDATGPTGTSISLQQPNPMMDRTSKPLTSLPNTENLTLAINHEPDQ